MVSQYMQSPRKPHLDAIMRILLYLKKDLGQGLLFSNNGHLEVEGYSIADWARNPYDRRSIIRYCVFVFVGDNLVGKIRSKL